MGPGLGFVPIVLFPTPGEWTNMPLAATELMATPAYRRVVMFEGFTRIRCFCYVAAAGTAGAILTAEYTFDLSGATAWVTLAANTISLGSAGGKLTDWENIPAAAKAGPVLLRFVGSGGDGVADPTFALAGVDVA